MGFLRGSRHRKRYRCPLRTYRPRAAYPLLFVPPPVVAPQSQVRQNYHRDCEVAVNNHIHLQLETSYVYLSMAFYCGREDVALENFSRFFLNRSHKCTKHAEMFLDLQNQRGGRISFRTIRKPYRDNWIGSLQAMESAFQLELTLNESLVDLHQLASSRSDAHLRGFLKKNFLQKQVEVLKEMSSHLTSMRRMKLPEDGRIEYLFDKLSLADTSKEK
ncbi:ferritin heavy chain A-like [Acomys russatus]|uniref:ferritin heavy chain A-like n=1 Tax=Acomys russatus TaxID=60746 RepID=UPI0021E21B37|nr:ferritin heavy chain A-like [Acomys russatus]